MKNYQKVNVPAGEARVELHDSLNLTGAEVSIRICRLVQEYLLCIRTSKMKKFMPSSPDAAPWWLTEKP